MSSERQKMNSEKGEVMLESSFILVSVIILLLALLSMCFMFYQQAMMTSIASEISSNVAKNYKYSGVAVNSEKFTVQNVKNVKMYRTSFGANKVANLHEEKAKEYGKYRVNLASLGINSKNPNVECEVFHSGIGRTFIKVTVTNKTEFFLSGIIKWLGIFDKNGFSAVSYAECTDLTSYTSTVNFSNYMAGFLSPLMGGIGKIYGNIKDIILMMIE